MCSLHILLQRYVSLLVSMECVMSTLDTVTAPLDTLVPPAMKVRN